MTNWNNKNGKMNTKKNKDALGLERRIENKEESINNDYYL